MPKTPIYVPILKGKEGEFAALEALKVDIRQQLMPLIEIPTVPYDYANERTSRTVHEHVKGIGDRLRRACKDIPIYLDPIWIQPEENFGDTELAFGTVLKDCRKMGVRAVPVVSRTSSQQYLTAGGHHSFETKLGVCFRLRVEDFAEDIDLEAEIGRIAKNAGGVLPTDADLILDLKDLGAEANRAVLEARSIFSMIPYKDQWRNVVFAASSFPEDLSEVDASTFSTLPRLEWDLWRTLQRRPNLLPRGEMIFADYAISHPTPTEIDPRTMRMSANIRYTAAESWLVVKGRNVRQYGFEQYFELCKKLIERPEYCDSHFSWGDGYIFDCAQGIEGPGNATTWRKVGTNHHLTLVVRQLSNSFPAS